MVLSDLSIKRPVFATVMSLLIIVFGLAALQGLAVREYPDIDAPVVSVTTEYTGAAPEVIDSQITQVIESAISGVDGIRSIESSSRQGRGRTSIEFEADRDVDSAANDVRDAVARVVNRLPAEADAPQIIKANADARPMMWIALRSDVLSSEQLTDYAVRNLVDRLSILSGVAQIRIGGERRYAIRIWLDRELMAARQVTVSDVERALRANNVELPAGKVESSSRDFTVRADNRLATVEAFNGLVVRSEGDYLIRLGDVARVALGVESEDTSLRSDGKTAIGLGIIRQSKANTVALSDRVQEELARLAPSLPSEISIKISYDESIFIRASIREVLITLGIAVVLVILVIFVFLRSVRATLIPAVTIPVSVIGAFIALAPLGFSINVLTLLALILAIGLVVDDAIVMLENVQRRVDAGEPPLLAAYRGARQVAFAIIATTLTLVAVFVPLSFMGGNVGRLFTEFGFTLAFAVIVSSFVALTLAPMLCSRWLHHSPTSAEGHRLWAATERLFDGLNRGYAWLLKKSLGAPAVVLALGVAGLFLAAVIFPRIGQELAPVEDRGVFIIPSSSPQGATAAYTEHHVRKVEQAVAPLVESGDVTRVLSIVGFGGQPERAFTIIGLAPWEARSQRQQDLAQSVAPKLGGVPGLRAFPVNPPGLGQSAFREPVQFIIGGSDYVDVQQWADALLVRARELPSLQNVDLDFEETRPQLAVDVLRDRAADLGISVEDVALTLQTLLASRQVTRYLDRGREYEVMLQAEREDRASPDALAGIFLRSTTSGELIPLSALVELREFGAAPELKRIDRLPAITLTASLAPGYDLGSALRELQGIAAEVLPDEARISYGGLSREFADTSSAIYVTFALAFLVVFLVLAAQFESWIHPLIIMLSVPLAVTGALLALWMAGISLNIYSQIGMVMLLGLMAKNGILIVEFANQLRDAGRSVRDAIIEGAILRFRPVLMTTISTVFGAIPLVLASGAGAESRMSIGVVILGGLLFATTLTLFIIPVLYDLLARFARSANAIHHELEQQAQAVPDRLGE